MAWKSILVHLKPYQTTSAALPAAVAVAKKFNASLTGLYGVRELAMLKLIMGQEHPSVREAETRDAPLARAAEEQFLSACREAGVSGHFAVAEGNANELLCLAGRVHDVLFVEAGGSLDGRGGDVVEECAVTAGTPVIIVPAGHTAPFGRCVVVAWNHSRQAATAVHAALPLIARADSVVVLIGAHRDAMPSVTRAPRAEIVEYISHYNPNVRAVPFDGNDGATLQSSAIAAGGDLLVMGAYGRSAWREFLLGGATRDVISDLKLPVLMAH